MKVHKVDVKLIGSLYSASNHQSLDVYLGGGSKRGFVGDCPWSGSDLPE